SAASPTKPNRPHRHAPRATQAGRTAPDGGPARSSPARDDLRCGAPWRAVRRSERHGTPLKYRTHVRTGQTSDPARADNSAGELDGPAGNRVEELAGVILARVGEDLVRV